MDFATYVQELLRINSTRLSSYRNPTYFANVTHGMVEEMLELYLKINTSGDNATDLILELGDILAYCVLTIAALRRDSNLGYAALANDIVSISEAYFGTHDTYYDLSKHVSILEIPLLAASKSKRWFRENSLLQTTEIFDYYFAFQTYLNIFLRDNMQLQPVDVGYVGQQNIQKLLGRVERQTLFMGTGDYR